MNGSQQMSSGRPASPLHGTHSDFVRPGAYPAQPRQPGDGATSSMLSHLELGPLRGSVPSARLHARFVAQGWGFTRDVAGVVELMVSELVTNAVLASQALGTELPSPIHLWMRGDGNQITIAVWDANPRLPERAAAVSPDEEGGRGLALVEVMSERWGCTATPDRGGKSVWCIVVPDATP